MADHYTLANNVYLADVDGVGILLDLRSNKYLALNPNDMSSLRELLEHDCFHSDNDQSRRPDRLSDETVRALEQRELITRATNRKPWTPVTVRTSSAMCSGRRREGALGIRPSHLLHFMSSYVFVSAHLRRKRLVEMMANLRNLKTFHVVHKVDDPIDDIPKLIAIFRRLRTLTYTAHNQCLLDSLVLTRFLLKCGKKPTLVLGVRTKPFVAHAWVQVDGCALDDRAEYIQTVTPILAL